MEMFFFLTNETAFYETHCRDDEMKIQNVKKLRISFLNGKHETNTKKIKKILHKR